jgi:hypothetical protein
VQIKMADAMIANFGDVQGAIRADLDTERFANVHGRPIARVAVVFWGARPSDRLHEAVFGVACGANKEKN